MKLHKTKIITQQGFTLLEAMVALLIFSVGLLGLAGMQAAAIRNNKGALDRTVAIQASYDMAEHIRSNRGGFAAGNYDNLQAGSVGCDPCGGGDPIQDQQFRIWEATIQQELPGAFGRVTTDGAGSVNVTIFWDGDRTGAAGTGCNPANPADLRCITLTVLP